MSLNKLVGGDCGGNNSLVQLSNIVRRDASVSQPPSQADRFVNEFMAQHSQTAQTFNMNALLNNLPKENVMKSGASASSYVPDLSTHMNKSWNAGPSTSYMSHAMMPSFPMMQQPMFHPQPLHPQRLPQVNVSKLYVRDFAAEKMTDKNVKAKAQEYTNTMENDIDMINSTFLSFMKTIRESDIDLSENKPNEFKSSNETLLDDMADRFQEEWGNLSSGHDYWHDRTETAYGIPKEYTFSQGNVMLENKSALEIGKEKLKMGDIPGAVLCFEAAAQQQPDSAEAWFLLGTTQAENEQDPLAITALKKSLEINPTQLEGYITLAAAYTNENMPKYAYISLLDWLKASPKYSDIFPHDVDPRKLDDKELQAHVKSLYLKAVQLNVDQIDPDVQNALGVVFNISQEYDKAVDCFQTGLMVANDNAKLWNRLGATLANSDKSEQAVIAYHQALNLEPGFIRARYNVGITCMNLGAHREAAEHFLVALNQQHKAISMFPEALSTDTSSSTIWTTLRMVCSFMGEHEVAKLADDRNLTELNKFFDVE